MLDFLLYNTPLLYLTQSLWRDEAFSVLTAEKPITTFIGTLNFEPPVYYVLLHIWIKFFGTSEIAVRSLSFLGFLLASCVVVFWAEKIFKKHYLSVAAPLLFFFNPMLLYYAFEVRAYGWLMFFSTLSLYAYSQKKYRLMTIANIFAFYTHSYAIFIPLTQFFHYVLLHRKTKHFFTFSYLIRDNVIRSIFLWGLAISPWMTVILREAANMRSTWYFPVDLQLVLSVLGNMFTSYDGTPGGMWGYTRLLSFFLGILFLFGIKRASLRKETSYLLTAIILPLFLVISVSFVKPLFVNRYLIFVTIAEVMLLCYAIYQIRNKKIQFAALLACVLLTIGVNVYLPSRKAKLDIRSTLLLVNSLRKDTDVIYVDSPLIFFEALYYTKDRQNVFLYNPKGNPFPWYVGESAFDQKHMVSSLPIYPKRAIIVSEDKTISIAYKTMPK